MSEQPFSNQLEAWLKQKGEKRLIQLTKRFGPKSFAVAFLILMIIPAIPAPTGGITHVFEIISMLFALEMALGRKSFWLPKRWPRFELGRISTTKTIPFIIKRIRWFEKHSKPRLTRLMHHKLFYRFCGLLIFILSLAAFLAPPFTGLDTLPAMGVVIISLSLILEDSALFIVGLLVGTIGVVLEILLVLLVGSQFWSH